MAKCCCVVAGVKRREEEEEEEMEKAGEGVCECGGRFVISRGGLCVCV